MLIIIRNVLMNDLSGYVSVRKINSFYTIEDSLKGVYDSMFNLMKLIEEQQKEIKALHERLKTVESKVNSLE